MKTRFIYIIMVYFIEFKLLTINPITGIKVCLKT